MRAVHHQTRHNHSGRGDAGVVVAEYQFGNTVVRVNDALIARTAEERDVIDEQIATAAYACLVDDGADDHEC